MLLSLFGKIRVERNRRTYRLGVTSKQTSGGTGRTVTSSEVLDIDVKYTKIGTSKAHALLKLAAPKVLQKNNSAMRFLHPRFSNL